MDRKDIKLIDAARRQFDVVSEKARIQIYRDVLAHYQKNPGSPWSGAPLRDFEKTIRQFYADLGVQYDKVFRDTLPPLMQRFYDRAVKEMRTAGVRNAILGKPDSGRIKYFLDSAFDQVAMKTQNMEFQHIKALRSLTADVTRQMSITGDTRREVSKAMLDRAMQIPGFEFIDKAGTKWPLKSYFNTLARTELMNAARASYDDKCASEGCDVMMLDYSGNCCEACARFEGRLFSLTGATQGLPTKEDLIAAGVFHPNCTHSYSTVPDYTVKREYNQDGTKKEDTKQYLRNVGGRKSGGNGGGTQSSGSMSPAEYDRNQHQQAADAVKALNNGATKLPQSQVVRLKEDPQHPDTRACYNRATGNVEIYDACPANERGFAELHERAHQWDYYFNITKSKMFEPVLRAIQGTSSYATFVQLKTFGIISGADYAYIMRHDELWARACSQYVAQKSNNKILLSGLDNLKKRDINGLDAGQWDKNDFADVYAEIDKLFKKLGVTV